MKARVLLLLFAIVFSGASQAQITSARSYSRRVIGPTNAPSRTPTNNTAKAAATSRKTNAPPAAPPPPTVRVVPFPGTATATETAKPKGPSEETVRKTVEFQKKRAEDGSTTAQYDLGMRYLTGDGVEKDPETARRWLEAAAKAGHSQAAKKLEELGKKEPAP